MKKLLLTSNITSALALSAGASTQLVSAEK